MNNEQKSWWLRLAEKSGHDRQRYLYGKVPFLLFFLVSLFAFWGGATTAVVQSQTEPDPIPTPDLPPDITADPAAGLAIYQQRCATCHGPAGLGDGPQAAMAIQPPTAIGDPAYLRTADPEYMFNFIANGNLEAGMPGFGAGNNSNPLSTAEIWDVVTAVYSLPQQNRVLDTAVITGQLSNATLGGNVGDLTVVLQAFTTEAVEALRLETTADADGRYQFDLTRVPPNWIYRTVVSYGTLEYSSDFAQLTATNPAAELPILIYETTSDTAVIRLAEIDSVLDFAPNMVRISELYIISNESERVFVGPNGTADDVTLRFTVPANASNIQFLRGGPTADDFFPLDEQIVALDDDAYGLTVPIPPGFGVARVLLQYVLPYEPGLRLNRPLAYPLETATLIIANSGVTLAAGDGNRWTVVEATEAMLNEDVRFYQHPPLEAGEALAYILTGFPIIVTDAQGQPAVVRDEQTELWVGVLVLLFTAVGVIFTGYRWTKSQPPTNEQDVLIQTLAALDEAYTAQEIRKSSYERQRRETKERLLAIWQE